MKKEKPYYLSLDDLAFQERNRDYGAYFLRKKYPLRLFISALISIFLFILLVSVPILMNYFEQPVPYEDLMPVIEFYNLNPPSDDELNALAKSLVKPPPQEEQIPVVVDTIKKEEKKENELKPNPEQETEPQKTDSLSGSGNGTDKNGAGPGDDTGIYTTIDVYPRFPGGDAARFNFLRALIRYPDAAIKAGIQGVVVVVFVIEQNGSVSNVEVSKGIGGGCDGEAIRVVKMMPLWEPGKRSGRAVRVLVKMPIVFRLPGKGTK
jgi:periplasmic protein TonB